MKDFGTTLCILVAFLDIIAAFTIIACQQAITKDYGWNGPQSRWSTIRRIVYTCVAAALFVKGVYRFENIGPMSPMEGIPQIIILIYITFFPLLRAFKVISQDALDSGVPRLDALLGKNHQAQHEHRDTSSG